MADSETTAQLRAALKARFGEDHGDLPELGPDAAQQVLTQVTRASCRRFAERPVPDALVRLVAAQALSAPSKSDLQQRDILWPKSPAQLARIKDCLAGQDWIAMAPVVLVFCGNNQRQRQMHALWKRPFENDHLDAFFNASVDAGIALATAVGAAETLGLGCCPISAIRNQAADVSAILGLPDHVFPVAGLALGWPATAPRAISPRLPTRVTLHEDSYNPPNWAETQGRYDDLRAHVTARGTQRDTARFGQADRYTWSDDKTRQYSAAERAEFGHYIRKIGFNLE